MRLLKIISGAQTGADRAALEWAKANGFQTGGWMPAGFRAEDGNHPTFGSLYGIRCTDSVEYPRRTELNVMDADVTVIFGDVTSRGSKLTIRLCEKHGKKWHHVQFPDGGPVNGFLELFLTLANPVVLNIAGNRESKSPGIGTFVKSTLSAVIRRP